jgi:DNA adenine methylase
MRPLLKWAGGKRSLINQIINFFPKDLNSRAYHELFFGGGAVFFNLNPNKGTINDINSRLINFYKVVRDHPSEIIKFASQYKYEKTEYYRKRSRFNEYPDNEIEDAALFLYLNKTGYNGLYRVNSKGKFNVPFGRYTNPTIVDPNTIYEASKILQNVKIFNEDFSYILDFIKKGDICYLDPPYYPTSITSDFTNYHKDGFNLKDQIRLRNLCLDLDTNNVVFVQSNSDTQVIRNLYKSTEFQLIPLKTNRMISSKVTGRKSGYDLLITNSIIKF